MGQAKQRGSLEDRKQKPKMPIFDKMTVDEIKDFFQTSKDAIFLGYVIYVEERDDFLQKFVEDTFTVRRSYCPSPEHALIFDSYKKAEKLIPKIPKKSEIGILFDLGSQFSVMFLEKKLFQPPISAR